MAPYASRQIIHLAPGWQKALHLSAQMAGLGLSLEPQPEFGVIVPYPSAGSAQLHSRCAGLDRSFRQLGDRPAHALDVLLSRSWKQPDRPLRQRFNRRVEAAEVRSPSSSGGDGCPAKTMVRAMIRGPQTHVNRQRSVRSFAPPAGISPPLEVNGTTGSRERGHGIRRAGLHACWMDPVNRAAELRCADGSHQDGADPRQERQMEKDNLQLELHGLIGENVIDVVTADIGIIQAIGQFDTASEGTLSLLETGARVILAAAAGFDMQSVRHEIQRAVGDGGPLAAALLRQADDGVPGSSYRVCRTSPSRLRSP